MMDDPLSRALREEAEENDLIFNQNNSSSSTDLANPEPDENASASLSISHCHNEWILPSANQCKEEAEINREQTKITVSDPRKYKSNLDSFVTYLITTQTFNDGVQIKETNVRRRYNDFVWLKTLLDTKYPFNIISALPAKHTISKKLHVVADDGEFIRQRMNGLQNFLRRIIENPVISTDPSVELFLTADDDAWHSAQQQQQQATTSACSLNAPVISSNSGVFRQPMGRGKPIPTEFSRTENQIQTFQDNLRKLERIARKIESEEISTKEEEENLLAAFKQWLDVEKKHAEEDDALIQHVCDAQQSVIDSEQDLIQFMNTKFIEPISDYILFTNTVQDALKRRAQLSENVTANSDNEQMFDQLTIANETIKADIQRWTESKNKELNELFYTMANKRVDFYNQSVNIWEQAAAKLAPENNKK